MADREIPEYGFEARKNFPFNELDGFGRNLYEALKELDPEVAIQVHAHRVNVASALIDPNTIRDVILQKANAQIYSPGMTVTRI